MEREAGGSHRVADVLRNAPGWMMSIALHGAVALAAMLLVLESFHAEDSPDPVRVGWRTEENKIAELDRSDHVLKRRAVPGEAPESVCDESPRLFAERSGGESSEGHNTKEFHGDAAQPMFANVDGGVRGVRRRAESEIRFGGRTGRSIG